jgi:hypothetical protein
MANQTGTPVTLNRLPPLFAVLILGFASPALAQKPVRQEVVGHFGRPDIVESSGIVASRKQPGVFWTMNDSGGPAIVYAFDLAGRDLGAWRVTGAANQDWESLSLGPCGAGSPSDCLYVGETGDNSEKRPNRTLYRVPEPAVGGTAAPGWVGDSAPAERLDFVYPDGPHDDEAIYVAPSGATWFVTKGRSKGYLLFRLDADRWGRTGVATAQASGELKLPATGRELVTDAGLSPDGSALAVRTYQTLFVFRANPQTGEPNLAVAPSACDLKPLAELQGEGVGWQAGGRLQVLTSEGAAGQISVVACPVPALSGPAPAP